MSRRLSPGVRALQTLDRDPAYDDLRALGGMLAVLNRLNLGLIKADGDSALEPFLIEHGFTMSQIERLGPSAFVAHKAFIQAEGNGPEPEGLQQ